MPDLAHFTDFYMAVNGGRAPFPWQARLADTVAREGWPTQIGVPTGLGKTACLDIAIWALARSATEGEGRAQTRIWYVVNRRLLVDVAFEHGRRVAALLANPDSLEAPARQVVATAADALRSLSAVTVASGPLHVARLRGAADLGSRAPDPSFPTIHFATVAMFASRWLFRGYGASRSMRPVDAAHAGTDSLVLLDEAHLSLPLVRLAATATESDTGPADAVLPTSRSRPVIVALTATGDPSRERFDLDSADLSHPEVTRRLHARKPCRLVETSRAKLASTLASEALLMVADSRRTCIVFTNTPRMAREVMSALGSSLAQSTGKPELALLTGRMRDYEARRVRQRLLAPDSGAVPGLERLKDSRLIVVATQTLEVGADLDFHSLVTESTGVRSLIQRLGRLNRLGSRLAAQCTVCHPSDMTEWPVYGQEPQHTWDRLCAAAQRGSLDLAPADINEILGEPHDVPQRVAELLPSHLWEWAKTTLEPEGEAPVECFFEGFDSQATVSFVWRSHQPPDGVRLFPPVFGGEAVDIPVAEARQMLVSRFKDHDLRRLSADRSSLETVPQPTLRPGDIVVMRPNSGCYDEFGWNVDADGPVLDVSPLHAEALLLTDSVLDNLAPGCLERVGALVEHLRAPAPDGDLDGPPATADLVAMLRSCPTHPWLESQDWAAFLNALGPDLASPVDDVSRILPIGKSLQPGPLLTASDAFDDLSFEQSPLDLTGHLASVGHLAELIADRLGLPSALVAAVRLAGEWHDVGKVDPRFQRWLDPDALSSTMLAKSAIPRDRIESARRSAGWPRGGRHELLSVRLATEYFAATPVDCDTELVLHLIAAHHGHGRPMVPTVDDEAAFGVTANLHGMRSTVPCNLGTPDWEQPARFRRICERYGVWGTALLESIVRQADHLASAWVSVA
ncbi:MAG: type I-G CRISPR-associated helicase/endonuclease Cas3g [Candidatus Dormibacteria bacterium]